MITTDKQYLEVLKTLRAEQYDILRQFPLSSQDDLVSTPLTKYLQGELDRFDRNYNYPGHFSKFLHSTSRFWFKYPREKDLDIEDIAHALSMMCRFGGHVKWFYSVAQHSWHVSHLVPKKYALLALLHDASEAITGDIITPLKRMLGKVFEEIENSISLTIYKKYGVEFDEEAYLTHVKKADLIMLVTEARDLTKAGVLLGEAPVYPPLDQIITEDDCWSPKVAKQKFLERFEELYYVNR